MLRKYFESSFERVVTNFFDIFQHVETIKRKGGRGLETIKLETKSSRILPLTYRTKYDMT